MGCDIHMWAEIRKRDKWESTEDVFDNEYYDPKRESKVDSDGYEWNAEKTDQPYTGRNYGLFGILADVRNGRGFAGCDLGDKKNIIAEPKGIPEDASVKVKAGAFDYGEDGHSHSWFTLKELQDFDWKQTALLRGIVDPEGYIEFTKKGKPQSYCGDVSGHKVQKITNEEMDDYLKSDTYKLHKKLQKSNNHKELNWQQSFYTKVGWEESYKESVGTHWFEVLKNLKKLGKPEDVRIVFFFDN
jgi:hypothetical protein